MKNNNKKIVSIFIIVFFSFINASAQKPTWINKAPNIKGDFYFKVVQGTGNTSKEAKTDAVNSLISQLTASQGVSVSGQTDVKIEYSSGSNGEYKERNNQISNYTIISGDKKVAFSIQDEYQKNGEYYYLVEISNNPESPQFKNLVFTSNYNPLYGLPSVVVPGLGQILKGDYKKGLIFFGAEMGTLAIIVGVIPYVASNFSTDDMSLEGYILGGAICFAGIHIWNSVDAFASQGARHVSIHKTNRQYKRNLSLSLTQQGVGLVYNF